MRVPATTESGPVRLRSRRRCRSWARHKNSHASWTRSRGLDTTDDNTRSPHNPATSPCSNGSTIVDKQYRGERRDNQTGDYQLGERTYNPGRAAFTTADTPDKSTPGSLSSPLIDPLTANTYSYVNGDPVNLMDPSGHKTEGDYYGRSASNAREAHAATKHDVDIQRAFLKTLQKHRKSKTHRGFFSQLWSGTKSTASAVGGGIKTGFEYGTDGVVSVVNQVTPAVQVYKALNLVGLAKPIGFKDPSIPMPFGGGAAKHADLVGAAIVTVATLGAGGLEEGAATAGRALLSRLGARVLGGAAKEAATEGAETVANTLARTVVTDTASTASQVARSIGAEATGDLGAAEEAGGGARSLFHYTTEEGQKGILDSGRLNPSLKSVNPSDARYGNGQYLTDIVPGTRTGPQLSRALVGNPFQGARFTHYLEIDVSGLDVVEGRAGVFVVPGEEPLDLLGRILGYGANG